MPAVDAITPLDPHAWRTDFPILETHIRGTCPLIYLDNAATAQRPRQVIQAMVSAYEEHYANVHRGVHWLSDQSTDLYENSREKVRGFINAAHCHEIIFTAGTTSAINLVARSWGDSQVQAGDEILVTMMEHHSNLVPWQQLAERTGCTIQFIPVRDNGTLALDEIDALVSERTKLVAITAISNVLGTINPLQEIIAKAHAVDAKVLVDAAQSAPHEALDVQQLQADFVAFSGHKMMGPSGVGVLYGRETILERMPPFMGGGSMIRRVRLDGFESADLPAKFEAGTPPIVPAIGLASAVDYLGRVGIEAIQEHERLLTQHAHQVLQEVGGVRILGPGPGQTAGIVSFVLDRIHAHDIAQICDRHGIAIRAGHHCAMPLHKALGVNASNRASFYFYNTLDEVDRLAEALQDAKKIMRRA